MKILVAEDDPVLRRVLQSLLGRWGFEVETAADGHEALAIALGPTAPRIAILDWMMPGLDGPDVCRAIRAEAREPYTYVFLLTGRDGRGDVIQGLDSGADDYLTKPFDQAELQVRLKSARRILDLETALIDTREQLKQQATHDHLTGLYNRQAIWELLERELHRARRFAAPLAVFMLDVDHFKTVNDTHGHLVGDEVLRETARRLRATLRDYDVLGRYGGEEFLGVASNCDVRGAAELGERLRAAAAQGAILCQGLALSATISVGVATCELPDEHARPHDLVSAADAAMYRAKQAGRDRVVAVAVRAGAVP